jgi:hypothetical protein
MAGIVLNKLFFPADDPTTSLLTYATFAVGFLTRPIMASCSGISAIGSAARAFWSRRS